MSYRVSAAAFLTLAAAVLVAAESPAPSVDLRPVLARHGLTATAQGPRGTCSLFAVAGAAEAELATAGGGPGRLSVEYLVWAANEAAGGRTDQAMFYEAVRGLQTCGVCAADLMPYRPKKAAAEPSAEAREDAAGRRGWDVVWLKRWDVGSGLSPEALQAVKRELEGGHPVAAGMRWPKKLRLGERSLVETPPEDEVFDGHSVLLVGYRDDEAVAGGGEVLFRNSAGPGWGEGGYARLTYDYLHRYANDALSLRLVETPGPDGAQAVAFEAEDLQVSGSSGCRARVQDMEPFGAGLWGGGRQLFLVCDESGWAEVEFEVPRAGRFELVLNATCAPDFGRFAASLDGKPTGEPFDLYSGRVAPAGPVRLGETDLEAGRHTLRLTSAGRNPRSAGFAGGVDSIELRPAQADTGG